jgi:hypothetical protein
MPSSDARKARRAASPQAGLPKATPTIGADIGDTDVTRRKVVATQTSDPENPTTYTPVQEESSDQLYYATPGASPETATLSTPNLPPHHTVMSNLISALHSANSALVSDESERNGVETALNRSLEHLHESARFHVNGQRNEAIPGMVAAGVGVRAAIRTIQKGAADTRRRGHLERGFPTPPTKILDSTIKAYLESD